MILIIDTNYRRHFQSIEQKIQRTKGDCNVNEHLLRQQPPESEKGYRLHTRTEPLTKDLSPKRATARSCRGTA